MLSNEDDLAKICGLTPVTFGFHIFVACIQLRRKCSAPVVVTIESRGEVLSSTSAMAKSEYQNLLAQDGLEFQTTLFQYREIGSATGDNILLKDSIFFQPEFQPAMIRFFVREHSEHGIVLDFFNINLADYIAGAHSIVQSNAVLQYGTRAVLLVSSDLNNSNLAIETAKIRSKYCPKTSPSVLDNHLEADATWSLSSEINGGPHMKILFAKEFQCAQGGDYALHSQSHRSSEPFDSELWMTSPHVHATPSPKNSNSCRFSSSIEGSVSREHKNGPGLQESPPIGQRKLALQHPFQNVVRKRILRPKYTAVTEGGVWDEHPILSQIDSPFPLLAWSIEGLENYEPENTENVMDIGEGAMTPQRDIPKLQDIALCSTTKPGPSASPGIMSPLQKTFLIPSKQRTSMIIKLGKPWFASKNTALEASRRMEIQMTWIEEPELEDSDAEENMDDFVDSISCSSEQDETETCNPSKILSITDLPQLAISNDMYIMDLHEQTNDIPEIRDVASDGQETNGNSLAISPSSRMQTQSHLPQTLENKETFTLREHYKKNGRAHSAEFDEHSEEHKHEKEETSSISSVPFAENVDVSKATTVCASIATEAMAIKREEHDVRNASERIICDKDAICSRCMAALRNDNTDVFRLANELAAIMKHLRNVENENTLLHAKLGEANRQLSELFRTKEEIPVAALSADVNLDSETEQVTRLVELATENMVLHDRERALTDIVKASSEAKIAAETELQKLKDESQQDEVMRKENDRLLNVILNLKRELDGDPVPVDLLHQLKQAKLELAMERAEAEQLRDELAKALHGKKGKSSMMKRSAEFFRAGKNNKRANPEESPRSIFHV